MKESAVKEGKIHAIIRLMRPKHYIKNLLIFVSLVFDKNLFQPMTLLRVVGCFIAFSLLTSVVYIFNDIHDVEADRQHEVKRTRPIASGAVTVPEAYGLAVFLLAVSIALDCLCSLMLWRSLVIMLAYFIVNLGYSLGLKKVPLLDVVLLVSGFLLRVLYGAAIIDSIVSNWVYLTVISLSFYLGLGKRRNELKKTSGQAGTRSVLSFYSLEFLDRFMYVCLTLAVAFYALWSTDEAIVSRYGTDMLVWTVPLVLILLMKYSADIESDSYGDPVDVITHDKVLLLMAACFVAILLGLIYIPLAL